MLYIVATPIGNLAELSLRAIEVLKAVKFIYAEDTRRSLTLLKQYGISTPLVRCDKFSEKEAIKKIISTLNSGDDIALISDAGMPLISDPGAIIIQELISNKLDYTVVSGACACINGLVLSGLDTTRFYMAGFLPIKNKDRDGLLDELVKLSCTLVFYVSIHDIVKDINYLYKRLGARQAVIARELTKIHEQLYRFTLDNIPDIVLKGEIVLIIEGNINKEQWSDSQIIDRLRYLISNNMDKKQAVRQVCDEANANKKRIYDLMLSIR